jgi:hypothetical protein
VDVYVQPSFSPSKSIEEVQLLANDAKGNTWIYGYLIDGKVHPVKAAEIMAAKPVLNKHYDYPSQKNRMTAASSLASSIRTEPR